MAGPVLPDEVAQLVEREVERRVAAMKMQLDEKDSALAQRLAAIETRVAAAGARKGGLNGKAPQR